MQFYRTSEVDKAKTLRDYTACVTNFYAENKAECIEEFLNKIQTEEGISALAESSHENLSAVFFVISDILRKYLYNARGLVSENDVRKIINYSIFTGDLFRFANRDYLIKLFWSFDLPKDVAYKLYELMTKEKKLTHSSYCEYILTNSSFPQELLIDALKYGKAPIAGWASENENMPLDSLLKWKIDTGQIATEDPTKHIIEEMPEPKEDEDFRKLKELVGKNFKMYRAAKEKFYSINLAQGTKDPQILTEILRNRNVNSRSYASLYDNYVAQIAARNPNCPPEILEEILRKGGNDLVSQFAAKNPNCPIDARIQWMRDTGQIATEDPTKHKIEMVNKPETNTDLNELRNLIGRNSSPIKKTSKLTHPNILGEDCLNDPKCINDFLEILKDPVKTKKLEDSIPKEWGHSYNVRLFLGDICRKPNIINDNTVRTIIDFAIRTGDLFLYSSMSKVSYLRYLFIGVPNMPRDVFFKLYKLIEQRKIVSSDHIADILTNPSCPIEILEKVLFSYDFPEYYGEWASENPSLPVELKVKFMREKGLIATENPLRHKIEEMPEPKEDEDFRKLKELVGKNFKMYRVAEDWHTEEEEAKYTKDPKILVDILRRGIDDFVSQRAAQNINCPPEMLMEILRRGKNDNVSGNAAKNPNCPIEMLVEVLRRGKNDYVSHSAAQNPNCPPEMLVEVLRRGNDDWMSDCISKNPNCPIDVKIQWMKDSGKIATEDPNKHKIEEVPEQKDEDLIRLKELVGRNFKMYRVAYIDDKSIPRSVILKMVSLAESENCPPETLIKILKQILNRPKNDEFSWWAAANPNCPPEYLERILNRGVWNSVITWRAASNPNCPPEALAKILSRGEGNIVSQYAAKNPNCPVDAKIQWMRDRGDIEIEDPSKHIIEKIPEQKDDSFEQLQGLIKE